MHAAEKLLPLVYDELRKLAAALAGPGKPGQTLQATALVHEAYLRLVEGNKIQHWNSRGHFFAAAAEAMRRILVESARRKALPKHGGGWNRVELGEAEQHRTLTPEQLIDLDEALTVLESQRPARRRVIQIALLCRLSVEQGAEILGISRATAYRHWSFARAWLLEPDFARLIANDSTILPCSETKPLRLSHCIVWSRLEGGC